MKIFLLIFSMLFPLLSSAQPGTSGSSVRTYLFNPEMRFERDGSQEIIDRKPLNFAVGYNRNDFSFALEYSRFEESSGNSTSSLDRIHQDFLLWMKLYFLPYSLSEFKFNWVAGAGAGAFQESVTSSFMGSSRTDNGGNKFLSGLMVGWEGILKGNQYFSALISVEGRALVSSEFEPNPVWSSVLRFGILFPLK